MISAPEPAATPAIEPSPAAAQTPKAEDPAGPPLAANEPAEWAEPAEAVAGDPTPEPALALGSAPPPESEIYGPAAPVEGERSFAMEESPESLFGADGGFAYYRLLVREKSTGAESTLLSEMSPFATAYWRLNWSDAWATTVHFSYQAEKLQADSGPSQRPILNGSSGRFGAGASVARKWSAASRTEAGIGFLERTFQHSDAAGRMVIDRVGTFSLRILQEQDLVRRGGAYFGIGAGAELITGGKGPGYDLGTGFGAGLKLYLRHETARLRINGCVAYDLTRLSSPLFDQARNQLSVSLGIAIPLGE